MLSFLARLYAFFFFVGGVTSLIIFYFSLLSDHFCLPELVPPCHLGFCKCRHAQGSALHPPSFSSLRCFSELIYPQGLQVPLCCCDSQIFPILTSPGCPDLPFQLLKEYIFLDVQSAPLTQQIKAYFPFYLPFWLVT